MYIFTVQRFYDPPSGSENMEGCTAHITKRCYPRTGLNYYYMWSTLKTLSTCVNIYDGGRLTETRLPACWEVWMTKSSMHFTHNIVNIALHGHAVFLLLTSKVYVHTTDFDAESVSNSASKSDIIPHPIHLNWIYTAYLRPRFFPPQISNTQFGKNKRRDMSLLWRGF